MDSDKLLSYLCCPICLDTMKPPIRQCSAGHAICYKCQRHITECPLCRSPISNSRAFTLEALSEEPVNCSKCNQQVPLHSLQLHEDTLCGKEALKRRELALGNCRNNSDINNNTDICTGKCGDHKERKKIFKQNNDKRSDTPPSSPDQGCNELMAKMDASSSCSTDSGNMNEWRGMADEDSFTFGSIDSSSESWATFTDTDKSLSDTSSISLDLNSVIHQWGEDSSDTNAKI